MANRFFLAVLFTILLCPAHAIAQRAIGVIWEAPAQSQSAREQLQDLAAQGISYIKVNQKLEESTWRTIAELRFTVYGMLPVRFPVVQTLSKADSAFENKISGYLAHFSDKETLKAVGVFSYGQVDDLQFQNALEIFAEENLSQFSKPLYYQTTLAKHSPVDSLFNFKMLSTSGETVPVTSAIGAYVYNPQRSSRWKLSPLKTFLEHTPANDSIPVFFDGAWLQTMQQKHPHLRQTLQLYASSSEPAFSLPKQGQIKASEHNTVIIALLLSWVIFAFTYNSSPVYQKSMARYFTGHKFYVDDVMQRIIRSPLPGGSILVQHTIAGAIFFYCIFHATFTSTGFEALYYYYPLLSLFGTWSLSIFILGFFITLFAEIICVTWLKYTNPDITHLSQLLNLYPWPLQINLLVITLMLTLFLAGQSIILIYAAALIFLLIFLSAFIITALDSSRYVASKKILFLVGTMGAYITIMVGLLIWMAASPKLHNVIELAASLPK